MATQRDKNETLASKAKPRFCIIEKAPEFVGGVIFKSATGKKIRLVKVTDTGQAEVKHVDLYQLLEGDDRQLFKDHFGKSASNCFLKPGTFKELS